jgi:hypothetical protein
LQITISRYGRGPSGHAGRGEAACRRRRRHRHQGPPHPQPLGAAQGSINAAISETTESHAFDTVKGSDYLADQDAVGDVPRGPADIIGFEHMGVIFYRNEEGKLGRRAFEACVGAPISLAISSAKRCW